MEHGPLNMEHDLVLFLIIIRFQYNSHKLMPYDIPIVKVYKVDARSAFQYPVCVDQPRFLLMGQVDLGDVAGYDELG